MRRFVAGICLLLLTIPAYSQSNEPPKDFPFQPGNRIVWQGDSTTEQYQYSTYLELYLTTRFPKAAFTFLNAGIGGDTAQGGANRFQSHVLNEKPNVVTINFGMNDAGYGAFNAGANKNYQQKTAAMLEAAEKAGVKVVLMSPNAVDPRIQDRFKLYLETQKQFYAPLRELAEKHHALFVDQYATTRAAQEKMTQDDPKAQKAKPYGDGFHTSPPGALLMAHAILTGLKAPALVSDVTIDAKTGEAQTKQCAVTKPVGNTHGCEFTRTDECLPLPMQKDWLPMLPYTNELKDLNWYGLTVKGLEVGQYVVKIDGVEVGQYSNEQLAKGVNLGNVTTGPIHDQAQQVLNAINGKNGQVHQRFRGVVMFQPPDWLADVAAERKPQELAKRMAAIDAAQTKINELVQPKPHQFLVKMIQK